MIISVKIRIILGGGEFIDRNMYVACDLPLKSGSGGFQSLLCTLGTVPYWGGGSTKGDRVVNKNNKELIPAIPERRLGMKVNQIV